MVDNIICCCYNEFNLRGTLGMSLVMQAKPKSAELILVFLILRVKISGKRTSQMVINVLLLEE